MSSRSPTAARASSPFRGRTTVPSSCPTFRVGRVARSAFVAVPALLSVRQVSSASPPRLGQSDLPALRFAAGPLQFATRVTRSIAISFDRRMAEPRRLTLPRHSGRISRVSADLNHTQEVSVFCPSCAETISSTDSECPLLRRETEVEARPREGYKTATDSFNTAHRQPSSSSVDFLRNWWW